MASKRQTIVRRGAHVCLQGDAHALPGRVGGVGQLFHVHLHLAPAGQFGNGLGQCGLQVGSADFFQ